MVRGLDSSCAPCLGGRAEGLEAQAVTVAKDLVLTVYEVSIKTQKAWSSVHFSGSFCVGAPERFRGPGPGSTGHAPSLEPRPVCLHLRVSLSAPHTRLSLRPGLALVPVRLRVVSIKTLCGRPII